MTTLLVSTVQRLATHNEQSCFLSTIDLDRHQILRRSYYIEPAYRENDPNPRGGTRGCRGIGLSRELVFIANYSTIFSFDHQWNGVNKISHPSCAGIHDILCGQDCIWVTSTSNDLLISFDYSGNLLRKIDMRPFAESISDKSSGYQNIIADRDYSEYKIDYRDPAIFNPVLYNRTHVNSVYELPGGDLLVSMGLIYASRYSFLLKVQYKFRQYYNSALVQDIKRIIWSVFPRGKQAIESQPILERKRGISYVVKIFGDGRFTPSLILPNMTVPSHSLHLLADGTVIYLNTSEGTVINFDPFTGKMLRQAKVVNGFLRGVESISNDHIVIGNRRELILFDLTSFRVVDRLIVAQDDYESVFAVRCLPSSFSIPPERLTAP